MHPSSNHVEACVVYMHNTAVERELIILYYLIETLLALDRRLIKFESARLLLTFHFPLYTGYCLARRSQRFRSPYLGYCR